MPSLLVALEGLSGTGKTTIARMLLDELRSKGHRVEIVDTHTNDHNASVVREVMRTYLLGHPARTFLCWGLRALQHGKAVKAVGRGTDIVLLDRFWGSTIAFDSYGNSVPREVTDWLAVYAGCKPDLTLFFSAPLRLARQRKNADTIKNTDFSRRVEQGFRNLASEFGWVRIDATQAAEKVEEACLAAITAKLSK